MFSLQEPHINSINIHCWMIWVSIFSRVCSWFIPIWFWSWSVT